MFACSHYNNCTENIEAVEGSSATLDSSIVFVDGGVINQPLVNLRLLNPAGNVDYSCIATSVDCTDEGNVVVRFERLDEDRIEASLTLMNLNLNDTGNYTIELESIKPRAVLSEDRNDLNRISITYHVNVAGV